MSISETTLTRIIDAGERADDVVRQVGRAMKKGDAAPAARALDWFSIGGDPAVLREYAQAAESVGYDFIEAPDHVLGQNPAGASAGERVADGLYHDPFVLFGYLAGICPKLGFSTGVLILPQRQTVLVAK